MWYLKDIHNDNVYIFQKYTEQGEVNYCCEYCYEYSDFEGNTIFVPDSLHEDFINRHEVEKEY